MLQLPAHLINRKERRARDARRGRMGEARYNARHKFCSDLCASAMHMRIRRIKEANEETALDMAVRNTL